MVNVAAHIARRDSDDGSVPAVQFGISMSRPLVEYLLVPMRLVWYIPGSLRRRLRFHIARIRWKERSSELHRAFCGVPPPSVYRTLLHNPHTAEILRDFHWYEYMRANPDLHFATHEDARRHFVTRGYDERRLMDLDRCLPLVPAYYCARYPELNLTSTAAAQVHYSYAGYYEGRFANADTEWFCNTDVHIFQFGKVGSHSIAAALDGRSKLRVLHLHWPTDLALHYPYCSISYRQIVQHPRERPLRIISASREIVSRVLSGALQYLSTDGLDTSGVIGIDQANDYLAKSFCNDCEIITSWFDHQFYCGLDIYKHPFDYQRGYIRISHPTVELFLYRMEDLPRLDTALAEFLEIPDFCAHKENAGERKRYGEAYRQLMASYTVPRAVLEGLYATNYMRYFYTDDERARFIGYWSRPRGA